jgi:hypothetical protein
LVREHSVFDFQEMLIFQEAKELQHREEATAQSRCPPTTLPSLPEPQPTQHFGV